ncbi:MAG TPA: DUF2914 domain-containing protein [Rhizomicrobium sp.]
MTRDDRIEPRFSNPRQEPRNDESALPTESDEVSLEPIPEGAVRREDMLGRPIEDSPRGRRIAGKAAAAIAVTRNTSVLQFHQSAVALRRTAAGWLTRHERILSMLAMVGGFGFDNYAFRRIDLPNTQAVFAGYLSLAALSMIVLHRLAARAAAGKPWPKWRTILPMATQFALGGLWSAFLVFYSRTAVLGTSWPFLLVLGAILLGNEILKRYHARLVFTAVLFFFASFSYTTVTLPIFTHTIGLLTFLFGGFLALVVFWFFCGILSVVGAEQWGRAKLKIAGGVLLVYATLNAFYFTGILPPLPLAMAAGEVYHSVKRVGEVYQAVGEPQPWLTRFGAPEIVHVKPGEPLSVYSAVFAPIALSTRIVHRWQHYDTKSGRWHTVSNLAFTITGGRDGGYRAYSVTHHIVPGDWRVDVTLPDGHIIGRVRFVVEPGTPVLVPVTLK